MSAEDLLNPVAPRNPSQIIHNDQTKVVEEEETKYVEGAELIPLPSKGFFYNWDQRYSNLEHLQVRQLNYTDEDILTTKSYFDNGTLFNELLKNVIVDPNGFPAKGLVPVDRETILLWLRSTAFGNNFEIKFKCQNPSCNLDFDAVWDLAKLEVPMYPADLYEELKLNGEIKVETPISKTKVRIIVPAIGKSLEAEKRLAQKKQLLKETKDFYGTGSLMLLISGIELENGKVIRNKDEISNHLTKIKFSLSDSRYIRKTAERINLKYNTKQDLQCPHCERIEEGVEMPILHPNFFWIAD